MALSFGNLVIYLLLLDVFVRSFSCAKDWTPSTSTERPVEKPKPSEKKEDESRNITNEIEELKIYLENKDKEIVENLTSIFEDKLDADWVERKTWQAGQYRKNDKMRLHLVNHAGDIQYLRWTIEHYEARLNEFQDDIAKLENRFDTELLKVKNEKEDVEKELQKVEDKKEGVEKELQSVKDDNKDLTEEKQQLLRKIEHIPARAWAEIDVKKKNAEQGKGQ